MSPRAAALPAFHSQTREISKCIPSGQPKSRTNPRRNRTSSFVPGPLRRVGWRRRRTRHRWHDRRYRHGLGRDLCDSCARRPDADGPSVSWHSVVRTECRPRCIAGNSTDDVCRPSVDRSDDSSLTAAIGSSTGFILAIDRPRSRLQCLVSRLMGGQRGQAALRRDFPRDPIALPEDRQAFA